MVAAVDTGNSTVVIGFFENREWSSAEIRVPTKEFSLSVLERISLVPEALIVSSVVDSLNEQFSFYAQERGIPCYFPDQLTPGLVDFSRYLGKLGPDRVCAAAGAASGYPLPLSIVDMGTATTVSVVDEKGLYQGGMILPGVGTMLKSLPVFTHRLPETHLRQKPLSFLGLDTESNIQNGVYYFARNGIQGILKELRERYPKITLLGSGGWSSFFREDFPFIDERLIFKGLQYFYYSYFKDR